MQRAAVRVMAGLLSASLLTGGSYLIANGLAAPSTPATLAIQDVNGGPGGTSPLGAPETTTAPASTGPARVTSSTTVSGTRAPDAAATPSPATSEDPPDQPQPDQPQPDQPHPGASASDTPLGAPRLELHLAATPDYHGVWAYHALPPGQTALSDSLVLTAENVDLAGCTLTHRAALDDADLSVRTASLPVQPNQPVELEDGEHTFVVSCPTPGSTVSDDYRIRVADRQPKRCKGFTFMPGAVTTSTAGELRDAMTGSWEGCVTTPWLPPYWVSIQFRPDGTYSAVSDEVLDGLDMNALYYGTEADHPDKRFTVEDFRDGLGTGTIDLVFEESATMTRDALRNIRMMGDQLSFEMLHLDSYGPLVFELRRR